MKIRRSILTAMLVAIGTVAVAMPAQVMAAQARLELPPGLVVPGDAVTGEIIIDVGADALGAYDLAVDCDPASMQVIPPVQGGNTMPFTAPPIHTVSGCHASLTAFQFSSFTEPTGAVSVANVTFQVDAAAAPGSMLVISLASNVMVTPMGTALPTTTQGAVITVGGGCGNGVLNNGEQCDDGNTVSGDCCSATCSFEFHTCDDSTACTSADTCVGGACVGTVVDCNDGNPCTEDLCGAVTGCQHIDNTLPCDDSDACTTGDTCAGGVCVGGSPPNCDDGDLCTDDSCDSVTGCQHANNTAACDDGDVCTTNDTCAAGSCVGGTALDCDDGDICTDDSCDATLGCQHAFNTAPCEDGDACTTNDACSGGLCTGGSATDCNDGDVCTDDSCDSVIGCQHVNNTAACDDSDLCTENDLCSNGVCAGSAIVCDDGDVCTNDSCDIATGLCQFVTDSTAACDDGNPCTLNDQCNAGACVGGVVNSCDDANGCTDDSCDPAVGCVYTNNTLACDDGDACTTLDKCFGGACVGINPPNCDDGDVCTDDSCDSALGCQHSNNTAACDDGDLCTTVDVCVAGACVGGVTANCDDGNICTDDSCDSAVGCVSVPNIASCDDGLFCNGSDTCAGGICSHAGDPCVGGPACNDTCNEMAGDCLKPAGASCTADPNACSIEQCDGAGNCLPATGALESVGPISAANGYPEYYVDSNGLALELCLQPGLCFDPQLELPFPNQPVSFPDNFPLNAPWWSADAVIKNLPGGQQIRLSLGLIAVFDNGAVVDGDQTAKTRIRIRGFGLDAGATYTVTHPYGTDVVTADAAGDVNFIDDVPGVIGNFQNVYASRIGPFLTWDVGAPAGWVGDPATRHVITGGPCGDNFFRVEGPGFGTPSVETNQFTVIGKIVDVCGNGIIDFGEQCDDGNSLDGDCCSSACELVAAGTACTDHNVCTDNSVCDAMGSCIVDVLNTSPCDDGDACTTADTCAGGICVGGVAPDCNDGNVCTDDSCDSQMGCVNVDNTAPCDDGDACTTADTCAGGICVGGVAPDCNDGNVCTDDSCDSQMG
ncbi:MAG: hypothetical protein ACE5E4_12165, partial [Candidatus Binatia bacterium]